MKLHHPVLLITVLVFLGVSSCEWTQNTFGSKYSYFITGSDEEKEKLSSLFEKYDHDDRSPEENYIVIYQIIKILHSQQEFERLNVFLSDYVERHIDDPFNAYYLLVVADNNKRMGALPVAVQYYERLVKNYSDLLVQGESVHLRSLENLIRLVEDPVIKVNYYKDLLARFPDKIDMGPIYYQLAETYEQLGDWDLGIQAYKKFLSFPDADIMGVPDAREEVQKMVNFYDRKDKDWVWEDLDALVRGIKNAIWRRDARRLLSYRGRVNFFAEVWAADESLDKTEVPPDEFIADINVFMRTRIHFSHDLDQSSNSREAYLKTWGWSFRIKTWYLYFRRVDFPADPEIHGKWEWGGIYFGDKPFSGSDSF